MVAGCVGGMIVVAVAVTVTVAARALRAKSLLVIRLVGAEDTRRFALPPPVWRKVKDSRAGG